MAEKTVADLESLYEQPRSIVKLQVVEEMAAGLKAHNEMFGRVEVLATMDDGSDW